MSIRGAAVETACGVAPAGSARLEAVRFGPVGVEPGWLERVREWARQGARGAYDPRLFGLWAGLVEQLGGGRAGLLCLQAMPVRLFQHQLRAVERVLFSMGGRALLADEVGLGKTVEAGAVLKELLLRGLASRALVLAPKALLRAWREELVGHCDVRVCVHPCGHGWDRPEVVLTSLEYARLPRNAGAIQAASWDLVVVDEAHRLKDGASAGFRLVAGLRKTYLLLVTATPVHNNLTELYNLISLLRPGQLGTRRSFRREFTAGPRTPRDPERLRRLVAEVMVRTRRHEAGLALPPREVQTVSVPFTGPERALYRSVARLLREAAPLAGAGGVALMLAVVLREAASSPVACACTLERLARSAQARGWGSVAGRLGALARRARSLARRSPGPKVRWLVRRVRALDPREPGQLVAFTQFASTALAAAGWLRRLAGVEPAILHGGLGAEGQRRALEAFRDRAAVLVSTDVGSEGHNLQFCAQLVNLDLAWNPMRIEQRIGRLHRLGQARPVRVVHLAVPGTIEEYVLALVYEKLGMFREVVGELDAVVAAVPEGLEGRVAGLVATSRTDAELREGLAELGEWLALQQRRARQAEGLTRALLDGAPAAARAAGVGSPP